MISGKPSTVDSNYICWPPGVFPQHDILFCSALYLSLSSGNRTNTAELAFLPAGASGAESLHP